MFRDINT